MNFKGQANGLILHVYLSRYSKDIRDELCRSKSIAILKLKKPESKKSLFINRGDSYTLQNR